LTFLNYFSSSLLSTFSSVRLEYPPSLSSFCLTMPPRAAGSLSSPDKSGSSDILRASHSFSPPLPSFHAVTRSRSPPSLLSREISLLLNSLESTALIFPSAQSSAALPFSFLDSRRARLLRSKKGNRFSALFFRLPLAEPADPVSSGCLPPERNIVFFVFHI